MTDIRYNVSELMKTAFGIKSPIYITESFIADEKPNLSFNGLEILPDYYEDEGKSWMGTPIIFPATFKGDTYKQYNGNGEIIQISLNDFQLPAATMFSFRRAKNITRTNLLGSNGTVKEIFGFDDWVIDVRGVALDEPNKTASEQLEELLKWEQLADSIKVNGKLFNQRKIDRVAISDWNDNIQQGSPGVCAFQFQLFSDEAIELIIK